MRRIVDSASTRMERFPVRIVSNKNCYNPSTSAPSSQTCDPAGCGRGGKANSHADAADGKHRCTEALQQGEDKAGPAEKWNGFPVGEGLAGLRFRGRFIRLGIV